jgi:lipoate-protein ligase A
VTDTWRLLVTEPTDGATNMAIDEAVWLGRRAGSSPPTLRFFAWEPPTISLGYGQPLDRHVDLAACHRFGVGIVRRLTGGSAIYHDGPERELTYSVVASADDDRRGRAICCTAISGSAVRWPSAPRALGAPARDGSASRAATSRLRVLLRAHRKLRDRAHGRASSSADAAALRPNLSPARIDPARRRYGCLAAVFLTTDDPLATLTTLEAALGHRPKFDDVAAALAAAFEREHGIDLRSDGPDAQETATVERPCATSTLPTPGSRAGVSREYPDYPRVGVGAVIILHEDKVLLVRRGKAPSFGKWSLPGGLVELGESTKEAIEREIREERDQDPRRRRGGRHRPRREG